MVRPGRNRMRTDWRVWRAWVATAVLLALCLCPKAWVPERSGSGETRAFPHADKVIHFTLFAVFAASWSAVGRSPRARGTILAAGLALAVGTEALQGLPAIDRDPDPLDALADAVGTVAGVVAAGRVWPLDVCPRQEEE
jgi:hypothetical protein